MPLQENTNPNVTESITMEIEKEALHSHSPSTNPDTQQEDTEGAVEAMSEDDISEDEASEAHVAFVPGTLLKIVLIDFMCHKHMTVSFGRKMNFITGQNGSGKSAIVAALQVCLGLSAKSTNRGTKIQNLIRHGSSGNASIRLTLSNEGIEVERFKPKDYGSRITVERILTRSGASQYKLYDENMKLISKRKGDVDDLRTKLNLFVDNPVCVLDQESAKLFLKGSGKDKYKLFLKATELYKMQLNLHDEEASRQAAFGELKDRQKILASLKQAVRDLETKLLEATQLERLTEECNALEQRLIWLTIYARELETLDLEEDCAKLRKRTHKVEQRIQERQEEKERQKEKEAVLEKEIDEIMKQVDAASTAHQRILEKLEEQSRPILLKTQEIDRENGQLRHYLRQVDGIKDALQELKRKNEGVEVVAAQNEKKQMVSKIEHQQQREKGFDGQVSQLQAEQNQLLRAQEQLELKRQELVKTRDSTVFGVQKLKQEKERVLDAIQSVEAKYGRDVPRILKLIQQQKHKFAALPLHIGLHVTLSKAGIRFWKPIEGWLRNELTSFAVHNEKDATLLRQLCRAQQIKVPSMRISKFTGRPHGIPKVFSAHDERALLTMRDVLLITDVNVFNILVDAKSIESQVLVNSVEEAIKETFVGSKYAKHMPKNMSNSFTPDANRFYVRNHTEVNSLSTIHYENPRYFSDKTQYSAQIDRIKAQLANLTQEETLRSRALTETQQEVFKVKRDMTKLNQSLSQAINDRAGAQRSVTRLTQQLEQVTMNLETDHNDYEIEIEVLSEQIRDAESEIESQRQVVAALEVELHDLQNRRTPLLTKEKQQKALLEKSKQRLRESQQRVTSLQTSYRPFLIEIQRLEKAREKLLTEEQASQAELTKHTDICKQARGKAQELYDGTVITVDELRIGTQGTVDIDSEEFATLISKAKRKVRHLKTQMETEQRRLSFHHVDKELIIKQLKADKVQAIEKYKERKAHFSIIKRRLKLLRTESRKRLGNWEAFKEHVQKTTSNMFNYYLSQRNHGGSVQFDDEKKEISFTWAKEASTFSKNRRGSHETKAQDTRQLSGGEKSFTTLAFLLAMGEVMECPFRVMDEFDVFMDPANRQIAMQEVCKLARSSAGAMNNPYKTTCQYIFITPNDISMIPDGQGDIRKLKMLPVQKDYGGAQQAVLNLANES